METISKNKATELINLQILLSNVAQKLLNRKERTQYIVNTKIIKFNNIDVE